MTSNLYKVGDWVYCEVSPFQPYVIRKIEELTKTPSGNVEAKVICAFRYQDIPASIMATVEKYQKNENKPEQSQSNTDVQNTNSNSSTTTTLNQENYYEESEVSDLNELQRYNLRHREVFFSKSTDTIAATTIRAKCSILLFNEEIERYSDYLNKEDQFYYHLTYDPQQKSLVADKGEIRVGSRYQAEIPHLKFTPNGTMIEENSNENQNHQNIVTNDRVLRSQLQRMNSQKEQSNQEVPINQQTEEMLQWCPIGENILNSSNKLADREIDQFLIIAKSVGTFARALDCNNAFKQPSLPLSAAAASRDITLFHAMNTLHDNNYDIGKAVLSLITDSGPVLCKDELEDWSAVEANLFEDALEKYGKDFIEIRKDYLPWKTMKSIIEYYYTWKTTDRYIQQKRIKSAEQESKLKQVYIPNHSKQNQSALIKSSHVQVFNQYDIHLKNSCESCGAPNTSTNQWYAYNPTNLVQLIMSGNTNPTLLANAQAQAIASLSNQTNNHIYQSRLCADCWIYYKKFSFFKYPNAKYERLNQLKNQTHKCSVNGCGREFKMKQLLIKHCGIAHGYFAKTNNQPGQNERPPAIRNRTAFYLFTTPMTKAARFICTNTIKLRKLAKKPFKLVELAELNKEWSKETRSISDLVEKSKVKKPKVKKLDVNLISQIATNRAKVLKKLKSGQNGVHNGHLSSEEDENSNDLVIDQENDDAKPEFFKYFEKKCTDPCYVPQSMAFPKPTSEQINKFHLNLINQSRKRSHEQSNGVDSAHTKIQNGVENDSNDSSPQSKRSLLIPNNNKQAVNHANKQVNNQTAAPAKPQQNNRQAQKMVKPIQFTNLPNSPEDIYYVAVNSLKQVRKEIESNHLRKMARKPNKILDQYQNLYQTFEKLSAESLAKYVQVNNIKQTNGNSSVDLNNETSNDTIEANTNGLKSNKINENNNNNTNNNKQDDDIVEVETARSENHFDHVLNNSNVVILD